MEEAQHGTQVAAEEVDLVIKNPGRSAQDFHTSFRRDATVRDVKAKLSEAYEGKPAPASQTLIYAGKVLKDEQALLSDILKRDHDPEVPHSLHLVIKGPAVSIPQPAPVRPPASVQVEASTSGRVGSGVAAPTWQQPPGVQAQQAPASAAAPNPAADNPFEGNPALAVAYNAALAAIVSAGPGAGPGAPGMQPFAERETPLLPPLPYPNLYQQPLLYMPAYSLVPQPPGPDGQPAAPRLAQVLAPVMPMMMPYGMGYGMGYGGVAGHQYPPYGLPPLTPQFAAEWEEAARRLRQGDAMAALAAAAAPLAPPVGGVLGGQQGGALDGGAGAARAARRNGRPHVRVRLVRINLRSLLQLAVLGVILYQHCPPGRFAVVAVVGLTLYLTGLAPLRRLLRRLTGLIPALHLHQGGRPGVAGGPPGGPHPGGVPPGGPPGAAPPGAPGGPPDIFGVDGGVPAPGGAAPGRGGAPGGPPPNPAEGGFVRELQALVIGFFTSLLPGFNMNPEEAAAFAAAQQAAAAEAAREAAAAARGGGLGGGGGGNHAHVD